MPQHRNTIRHLSVPIDATFMSADWSREIEDQTLAPGTLFIGVYEWKAEEFRFQARCAEGQHWYNYRSRQRPC